jgi:hypothetical protein
VADRRILWAMRRAGPGIRRPAATARGLNGLCVGQTGDHQLSSRGLWRSPTEDGRAFEIGETAGSENRLLQPDSVRPFMIADAVRYMSVQSRKQPDSH